MRKRQQAGFSIVELLVVISILAIMASGAIVFAFRGGFFANNELNNASRELHSMLRAAQIYAATYNVKAGVVYMLDNYVPPPEANDPAGLEVFQDSYTGQSVRAIFAAAMVYELPTIMATPYAGRYYPIPREEGEFRFFPGNMTVLLQDPITLAPLYYSQYPRMLPAGATADPTEIDKLYLLGMQRIELITENEAVRQPDGSLRYTDPLYAAFPAHVFSPGGQLDAPMWPASAGMMPERFEIHVAPLPSELWVERAYLEEEELVLNDGSSNLRTLPIEIFRSTGRVRILL